VIGLCDKTSDIRINKRKWGADTFFKDAAGKIEKDINRGSFPMMEKKKNCIEQGDELISTTPKNDLRGSPNGGEERKKNQLRYLR